MVVSISRINNICAAGNAGVPVNAVRRADDRLFFRGHCVGFSDMGDLQRSSSDGIPVDKHCFLAEFRLIFWFLMA